MKQYKKQKMKEFWTETIWLSIQNIYYLLMLYRVFLFLIDVLTIRYIPGVTVSLFTAVTKRSDQNNCRGGKNYLRAHNFRGLTP